MTLLSSDIKAIISLLDFNGWHVTFYNHEQRSIDLFDYFTVEEVRARGWQYNQFPTLEEFIDGLFESWGDVVGRVDDNLGNLLYSNMEEIMEVYHDVNDYG